MENIVVTYKNKKYTYEYGTTLYSISKNFVNDFENIILIGSINKKPVELSYKVTYDCEVEFFDNTSLIGNIAYENGLIFSLIYIFKHFYNSNIIIDHSMDKGVYIKTNLNLNDKKIEEIKDKLKETINLQLLIEKKLVNRMEAIKYYHNQNELDKVNILKYTTNTNINLYRINDVYDYFFSFLPVTTGVLSEFDLTQIDNKSFILSYPNIFHGNKISKYKHHKKLFDEYEAFGKWSKTLKISNISDLNKKISEGNFEDIVLLSENYQNNKLLDIASKIANNKKKKIVLISGPSSSGKTTTSKKLKLFLRNFGLNPISLSTDDYYFNREDTPKKSDGTYDFESINAIDIKLFNKQLKSLIEGKKVKTPTYNFILGKKEYIKDSIELKDNEIIIIEGLHAINDKLTKEILKENKYKIYISPLTVLNLDNHNRVRTTDVRLLRRIVRDNRTRGYNASDTLRTWDSVRSGEEEFIFDFQDEADVVFNTSLIYELNILKTYAEPLLYSVDENDDNYNEAVRLLNLLNNVLPAPSDLIPKDSIIREFIGNSYFNEED